jgi:hypothetical protein
MAGKQQAWELTNSELRISKQDFHPNDPTNYHDGGEHAVQKIKKTFPRDKLNCAFRKIIASN